MTDKILAIYLNRETQEYHRFEVYSLDEKFTKENLTQKTEAYNANNAGNYIVKLYDDPIMVALAQDARSYWQRERVLSDLESICNNIRDNIDSLEDWSDEVEELLREYGNDR